MKQICIVTLLLPVLSLVNLETARCQTITGAWKGKIKNTKVELKLIRTGDSLTGTSYYYDSKTNFRRYSVKGYFDPNSNQVIWWDELMLTDKASGLFARNLGGQALLSMADFNCPGEQKMLLDGSSSLRDDKEVDKGPLHFQKSDGPYFNDEWDFVIENYTVGANDPYIIDSISSIARTSAPTTTVPSFSPAENEGRQSQATPVEIAENKRIVSTSSTVEQKFTSRKKTLATVIPITADSIELRFYDNAEIDGDSIALFINGALVFKNIRLTDQAYIVKFASSSLQKDNELVMVAENLGSIPPNTSLMVAIVGEKRFEARLQSTENSSALIRFIKQAATDPSLQ